MARRRKAAAAVGKRKAPAALPSPASSSEDEADEAPEQVSFGVAREAAEAERKLVGEAARRHRELLKEKRRRHQELFAEQKVRRRPPTRSYPAPSGQWANARLTPLSPAEAEAAARGRAAGAAGAAGCGHHRCTVRRGFTSVFLTRSKGNYAAVCLKDQSLTGLHQQLAKDFLNTQLYGPHTNRVQANEFFSLANKKDPVKKAAVQFVDKSWGEYKKSKWVLVLHIWLKVHLSKTR
ncbi:NOL7 protein, partial [Onychorhynchus coronatus]|nr:NOL7 protein [Onychorhynchus coronatus]